MDSANKKIALSEVLSILENKLTSNNPILFVNPSATLETFFTYKGTLVEISKHDIKLKLGKTSDVSDEIRGKLASGIQRGEWVVFTVGSSSSFNFAEFFKQLSFNKGDASFFDNSKILSKDYLKSSGILKEEEDKDFFGNHGYYKVHDDAKVLYLATCEEKDISNIKANNSGINFEIIVVE